MNQYPNIFLLEINDKLTKIEKQIIDALNIAYKQNGRLFYINEKNEKLLLYDSSLGETCNNILLLDMNISLISDGIFKQNTTIK